MKKIVHVTFSDDSGGAAIAAYRLHRAMLACGLDSNMLVFDKKRSEENIYSLSQNDFSLFFAKFKTYVIADRGYIFDRERGFYSKFIIGSNIKKNKVINSADIIVIHWICKGVLNSHNIIDLLKQGKEVFWVMHDMFPITGGCHHSFDCENFMNDCDHCPFSGVHKNEAHKQFERKCKLKKYNNMHWIAPSKWLFDKASSSNAICKDRLYNIPNIISDHFFPLNKEFSRKALKLDNTKKYVLYGADGVINNPYKRIDIFFDVINALYKKRRNDIEVLIFGTGDNSSISDKIPYNVHFMGAINDERTMNLLYNASDVFVSTSMAENYPLTIQEAKYCDIPIVSFDVGGTSDVIGNYTDGKLIPFFDVSAMANAIDSVLSQNHSCFERNDRFQERNDTINRFLSILNAD